MKLPLETKRQIKGRRPLSVRCNDVSKTGNSFNLKLRPKEAIRVAASLLHIAVGLLEKDKEGTQAIQVYNIGPKKKTLGFGITTANPNSN